MSGRLRQFIEIGWAVTRKPKVVFLDVPTATQSPAETDSLLQLLQRLASNGMAIIYISHRIPEVFKICNTVTILRDGTRVAISAVADTTPESVVDQMVGRELKLGLQARRQNKPGDTVLEARGIQAKGVNGIDLTVRSGEIVGLGGLVCAGRT